MLLFPWAFPSPHQETHLLKSRRRRRLALVLIVTAMNDNPNNESQKVNDCIERCECLRVLLTRRPGDTDSTQGLFFPIGDILNA